MKLTIYRYLFSFALVCAPALFGATTSDSIPSEQYQHVLQQDNIPATIATKTIPTLQELALRSFIKDITTKRPLTTPLSMTTQLPTSTTSLSTHRKPITLQTLQIQAKKWAQNFLEQQTINPIPTSTTEVQTADDLRAIIASLNLTDTLRETRMPSIKSTADNILYARVEDELFNHLASILAKDYFLKLSPTKDGRKPGLLPDWLREYFTGVSIQDLLDYNDIDFTDEGIYVNDWIDRYLWLDNLYINDLTGLDNTPATAHNLHSLRLTSNLITTIESNTFAKFQNITTINLGNNNITIIEPHAFNISGLHRVFLYNNPIAKDPKERTRIEEEVRTATNGNGQVIWDEPIRR